MSDRQTPSRSTTRQTAITLWHYTCPECGVGDGETGYHAPTHALYCEICLEDNRHVRLRRWPAAESSATLAGGAARSG